MTGAHPQARPGGRLDRCFARFAAEPADPPTSGLRKSMGIALSVGGVLTWLLYAAFFTPSARGRRARSASPPAARRRS